MANRKTAKKNARKHERALNDKLFVEHTKVARNSVYYANTSENERKDK